MQVWVGWWDGWDRRGFNTVTHQAVRSVICAPSRLAEPSSRRRRPSEPVAGVFEREAEMQRRSLVTRTGCARNSVELRVASPGRHGYCARLGRVAACRTSGPKRPSLGRMGQIGADCLAGCVNTNLPWERNLGDVGREPRRRGTPDLWSSSHRVALQPLGLDNGPHQEGQGLRRLSACGERNEGTWLAG